MMNSIAPIMGILAVFALAILLFRLLSGQRYANHKERLVLKSLCSFIFWLFSWIMLWYTNVDFVPFTVFMLVGFTLSVLGDVFLVYDSDKSFILGLFSFLLAHVAYSISFVMRYGLNTVGIIAFVIIGLIGFAVINFSGLFVLGNKRLLANIYLFIISFMLANAVGGLFSFEAGLFSALLTALGALLFFISDLILAYGKFRTKQGMGLEKPVLLTYYSAQIILALGMMTFLI